MGDLLTGIDGSPPTILVYNVTKRGPPIEHRIGRRSSIALRLRDDTPFDFVLSAALRLYIFVVTAMTISNEI